MFIWKHTRYFKTIHWPGARFETSGSGREIAPSKSMTGQTRLFWCVFFFVFVFVDLGEKMISHHVGQVLTEQKYLSLCVGESLLKEVNVLLLLLHTQRMLLLEKTLQCYIDTITWRNPSSLSQTYGWWWKKNSILKKIIGIENDWELLGILVKWKAIYCVYTFDVNWGFLRILKNIIGCLGQCFSSLEF